MEADQEQPKGWLQQNNLMYVGLIGIGLILVQPFLTATSLDLSSAICVIAFSLAIPLLAVLSMITQLEVLHGYAFYSRSVVAAKGLALLSGFVGVVAAFWHIRWIAGVGILTSGTFGLVIYSAFYTRLSAQQAGDGSGG